VELQKLNVVEICISFCDLLGTLAIECLGANFAICNTSCTNTKMEVVGLIPDVGSCIEISMFAPCMGSCIALSVVAPVAVPKRSLNAMDIYLMIYLELLE